MIGTNTQPPNQWREVCRWDVEPSEPIEAEDVDWREKAEYWRQRYEGAVDNREELLEDWQNAEQNCADAEDAFSNAIAAFEELAGAHRETLRDLADMDLLYDTLWREFNSLQAVPPSPGPDYSLVRPHWARRRRSRTAPEARSEAAPTEDTAEAVSASPARSGEPTAAQQMDRLLPEIGEETPGNWYNTDLLDAQPTGLAVCRWEVGRWCETVTTSAQVETGRENDAE